MVSIFNSVSITAAHILLFDRYAANHIKEMELMKGMPLDPKLMMLLTGPIVGAVSGLILGLFAWIASRMIKRKFTT